MSIRVPKDIFSSTDFINFFTDDQWCYSSHSEVITHGLRVLSQSASGTLVRGFAYHAIPCQFGKSALSRGSIQVSLEKNTGTGITTAL